MPLSRGLSSGRLTGLDVFELAQSSSRLKCFDVDWDGPTLGSFLGSSAGAVADNSTWATVSAALPATAHVAPLRLGKSRFAKGGPLGNECGDLLPRPEVAPFADASWLKSSIGSAPLLPPSAGAGQNCA